MDLVVSKNWLKEMEKAFTLTQVSDDLKTNYAGYFLKNEANYGGNPLVRWKEKALFLGKDLQNYSWKSIFLML